MPIPSAVSRTSMLTRGRYPKTVELPLLLREVFGAEEVERHEMGQNPRTSSWQSVTP
jgi:hypothetical protein